MTLLAQIRENLASLPRLVSIASSNTGSSTAAAATLGVVGEEKLEDEVYQLVVQPAFELIDELAMTQLVSTVVECTTRYAKKILFGLPMEKPGSLSSKEVPARDGVDDSQRQCWWVAAMP